MIVHPALGEALGDRAEARAAFDQEVEAAIARLRALIAAQEGGLSGGRVRHIRAQPVECR